MFKKFMLVFVALSFASPILLTGCNTVEGAGKDVESAGKAVKKVIVAKGRLVNVVVAG